MFVGRFLDNVDEESSGIDHAIGKGSDAFFGNVAVAYQRRGLKEDRARLSEVLHGLQHLERVVVVAVYNEKLVGRYEIFSGEDGVGGALRFGLDREADLYAFRTLGSSVVIADCVMLGA